ncbi:hypothetical protein AcdelDRAFT_0211 [Acidovorax delafieldii 2AN]|uniref:Uncharacterized protein n=1 Tax=Acidovorax delafieldii 2AN TaxID=573060 RepID=C5SZY1_ACIDE|nr:hypothetical protein AcdelDRAFT_0211 [Acidovorax delafieldii 2AN]
MDAQQRLYWRRRGVWGKLKKEALYLFHQLL